LFLPLPSPHKPRALCGNGGGICYFLPGSRRPPWRPVKPWLQIAYERRTYQPIWDRVKAEALLDAIRMADQEGLDPRIYGIEAAREALEAVTDPLPPQLDVFLTGIFFRYAVHLSQGRLDPAQFYPEWRPYTRNVDLLQCLEEALRTGDFKASLAQIAPHHPSYRRMKDELFLLKEMSANGNVPSGLSWEQLVNLLTLTGDLTLPPAGSTPLPPTAVREALRLYQWRHGLPPTGKIDLETKRELSVPITERIRRLEINMERWRWLPDEFGPRYIITILPDLMLYVVDEGRTVMSMKTVIGTRKQPSPILRAP